MSYKPNLNDPRIRNRIGIVLNWCNYHLDENRPRSASKDKINKAFGSSGKDLSDYLRKLLLIEYEKSYSVGSFCKSYLLNKSGYADLEKMLNISGGESVLSDSDMQFSDENLMPFFLKEYGAELSELAFNMSDSSNRLWHPLQNISRERKTKFWNKFGLVYDYDIEACAPTIILQLAIKSKISPLVTEFVADYLNDRDHYRSHIANLTGLSLHDSKRLINSFFNGAKLAKNNFCSAFVLLKYDVEAMEKLQSDKIVRSLRRNITAIWRRLELVEQYKHAPSAEDFINGRAESKKSYLKTSKQKWGLYFSYERKILDVIIDELEKSKNKFFTEHDGFRTEVMIDIDHFEKSIYEKTGLKMKIHCNNKA